MYIWNVMRAIGINKTERGLRVFNSSRADKSNLSEFGTIMTPPLRKQDGHVAYMRMRACDRV